MLTALERLHRLPIKNQNRIIIFYKISLPSFAPDIKLSLRESVRKLDWKNGNHKPNCLSEYFMWILKRYYKAIENIYCMKVLQKMNTKLGDHKPLTDRQSDAEEIRKRQWITLARSV